MTSSSATLLLLFTVLAHARVAHAADVHDIRGLLRVQPGATCLRAEQLAPEVEQWLNDSPFAADVTIVVDGSATESRNVRVNVVRDGQTIAQRTFEPGPSRCEQLHEAVALAIAMALKAAWVEGQKQLRVAHPAPASTAAVVRRWSLSGAVLVTYRLLPELAPALGLAVGYRVNEQLALRVGAIGVAAWGVQLDEAGSFNATLAALRADVCGRRKLVGILHGGLCIGVLGGLLHAAGTDVTNPESATVPAVAMAGAAELELELSMRWSFALGLSMTLLLHHVEIGVEDSAGMRGRSVALPNPGFALGLGPAYHFD